MEDHSNPGAHPAQLSFRQICDAGVTNDDGAGRCLLESIDQSEQRALPRPRIADDRVDLPCGNIDREVVNRDDRFARPSVGRKNLANADQLYSRQRAPRPSCYSFETDQWPKPHVCLRLRPCYSFNLTEISYVLLHFGEAGLQLGARDVYELGGAT